MKEVKMYMEEDGFEYKQQMNELTRHKAKSEERALAKQTMTVKQETE
jgi:hypothetical protein